jgi:hypothetical protein
MVREISAESFWDDGSIDDDEKCEKYLKSEDVTDDAANDDSGEEAEEVAEEETQTLAQAEDADGEEAEENDDDPADEEDLDASAAQPRGKKMAKKAVSSKTKAESIREVIEARKKAGKELRPRFIIADLEDMGVEVNASQVSITLRTMGVPPSRKGGAGKKPAKAHAEENGEAVRSRATAKASRAGDRGGVVQRAATTGDFAEVYRTLTAAQAFVQTAGSIDLATRALEAYSRLQAEKDA